jgi:hypothetical protein
VLKEERVRESEKEKESEREKESKKERKKERERKRHTHTHTHLAEEVRTSLNEVGLDEGIEDRKAVLGVQRVVKADEIDARHLHLVAGLCVRVSSERDRERERERERERGVERERECVWVSFRTRVTQRERYNP